MVNDKRAIRRHCKINNLHMRNVLVLDGKIKPVTTVNYGFLNICVARNEEFKFVINVEIPRVIH